MKRRTFSEPHEARPDIPERDVFGERLQEIAATFVVESSVAPGCVLGLASRFGDRWIGGLGCAGVRSVERPEPIDVDTPFDLASVTKPFVATCLARLARARRARLDDPLERWLGEARGTPSGPVPLELFLAHRAGLAAHRDLYAPLTRGQPVDRTGAIEQAARARRSECVGAPPAGGFPPVYSDLSYLLVGQAIAAIGGGPLDRVVGDEVIAPLGLATGSARQWRARDESFGDRVAGTEHVDWRGGEIRGEVHDENAWALAGHGAAGQAGLFGAAEDVVRFGMAVLDASSGRSSDWLSAADVAPLLATRPGGTLRAGFDGRSAEGASSGARFGARTFGHLGFTGTSLWCDPDAEIVAAVLTNRVCPTRSHIAIRSARPVIHDALYALVTDRRARRGQSDSAR